MILLKKKKVSRVITVPNIGRCDQTYLYHIVSNYNHLSVIVLFLPGSVNMEDKKVAIKLLVNILKTKKATFIGGETKSIFELFHSFSLSNWVCQNVVNQELNNESTLFLCPPSSIWQLVFTTWLH